MLMLQFQCGDERYGLDVSQIIEVAPMVVLRKVPHSPVSVAGLFNYRGTLTPVIDLSVLLLGVESHPRMSTRIILVEYIGMDGSPHILGLLAERATEIVSCREADFQPTGIAVGEVPCQGEALIDAKGTIQRIQVNKILPQSLQDSLFAEGENLLNE